MKKRAILFLTALTVTSGPSRLSAAVCAASGEDFQIVMVKDPDGLFSHLDFVSLIPNQMQSLDATVTRSGDAMGPYQITDNRSFVFDGSGADPNRKVLYDKSYYGDGPG